MEGSSHKVACNKGANKGDVEACKEVEEIVKEEADSEEAEVDEVVLQTG